MPNLNSYTYVHNHNESTNLMKQELITATGVVKLLVRYQIVVKQNA